MPTVIDSLIVQLGLDPSGFTDGQRQMAANLRRMEENARRANQNIQRSGHGIVSFFRGLESPLGSLRQHFEKLATATATPQKNLAALARQSQQTGQALTVAQRNYDAVVKSAGQSGMRLHSLGQQGRRTGQEVEAGALQGAAGLRAMGAAGLTALVAFTALSKMKDAAVEGAKGLFSAGVGAAGAGIGIGQYTAISQALYHKGNVPEAETQAWLSHLRGLQVRAQSGDSGAAQELATIARFAPGANPYSDSPEKILEATANQFHSESPAAAIGQGNMIGQTDAMALALHNLGAVELERQIQLERQRSATADQYDEAEKLLQAENDLAISWHRLSRILNEDLDPLLARFDEHFGKFLDALSTLVKGGETPEQRSEAFGNIPLTTNWFAKKWQQYAPSWLGGSSASSSTAPVPSDGVSGTPGPTAALPSGLTSDDLAIMQRESRGNPNIGWSGLPGSPDYSPGGTDLSNVPLDSTGFPLWMGKMGPAGNSTAAGDFMITATNWHRIAPQLGIHDFSPESQLRVRRALQAESLAAGQPANTAWAASGAVLPIGPVVTGAHIQSIQAAQAGNSTTTHTTTSNDVDINGGIHVYGANPSDGYKTGGAINDRINAELLTQSINTGQQ